MGNEGMRQRGKGKVSIFFLSLSLFRRSFLFGNAAQRQEHQYSCCQIGKGELERLGASEAQPFQSINSPSKLNKNIKEWEIRHREMETPAA